MGHRLATQLVALIVVVTLLSGGAVGLLVIDRARQALREEILLSSLAAADLAASLAAGYMFAAEGDARDLALSSELRTRGVAQGDLGLATPALEGWLPLHPTVLGVGIVDLTGVTRATGLVDKSFVNVQANAERDWFQGTLSSGEPFLGAPGVSPVTHKPQVPYGVPVRDEAGTMRGILIASISIEALSNTITAVQVGPNARTSLNDIQHGVILAHVDPSRILQAVSGKNEATNRLDARQRGAMENVNSSGQRTLAAFAPVIGLPWGLIIQQPLEDAYAPVDELLREVVALIAVALVLAAAVGAGLAVGITRPIRRLRTALEAMAGGELGQRVRTTRRDELGELGRGFDRMADRLQQTLTDLQEGEATFRGIISAAFDGFAIHDDGTILEVSETFASLFGHTQHELVGGSVLDLVAPESREMVMHNILAGLEEPYECIGVTRDQEPFYMELVGHACRFEGRPARTVAVRDVTVRRQAEEQRNRMAAIMDFSSEAIVGTTESGLVTDWNRGAQRIYGYSAQEMVGSPVDRIIPPEGGPGLAELRERISRHERIQSLETVRVRKDGTRIEVSISISPVRDGLGRVVGSATVAHDITERKRAEAALQESETRYRRLVELSPQAILVHDGTTILYANLAAARLAGETGPAELVGTLFWDLVHPDDRDTLRLSLAALPAEREVDNCVEARLVLRDGQVLETEVSAIQTTYGGQPAYQTIVNDITPRKTAEKQARSLAQVEKLRALGQMATGIAHDLNQSLMLVASYSDLAKRALDREPPDLEELRELFTTATQAALDGGEAVKRLLLFTRQSAEHEVQPVDLNSLVREVARMTAPHWRDTPQVEGRPIRLSVEAVGFPLIVGSAARLREALTNLVFNAVDALPAGGAIQLAVMGDGERAIIRVTDTGVGMNPEVQARIFEPFYTTKGGSGTGLGLSLVYGIVEQHGGSVHVRSAPGEGTAFQLSFPLLEATALAAPPATRSDTPRVLEPLRVLAVDDEPAMTKAIVRMLRPAGHLVSVAASGEEALARMAVEEFDVVVSDMGMGSGMNGWEFAAAVKRQWPNVRFLLATGWGAAIDPSEASAKGVEAILSKPYRPSDLEQALAGPDLAA
jgi:two-component system cell cycle sensor histidine kinase/response regulator CckA